MCILFFLSIIHVDVFIFYFILLWQDNFKWSMFELTDSLSFLSLLLIFFIAFFISFIVSSSPELLFDSFLWFLSLCWTSHLVHMFLFLISLSCLSVFSYNLLNFLKTIIFNLLSICRPPFLWDQLLKSILFFCQCHVFLIFHVSCILELIHAHLMESEVFQTFQSSFGGERPSLVGRYKVARWGVCGSSDSVKSPVT